MREDALIGCPTSPGVAVATAAADTGRTLSIALLAGATETAKLAGIDVISPDDAGAKKSCRAAEATSHSGQPSRHTNESGAIRPSASQSANVAASAGPNWPPPAGRTYHIAVGASATALGQAAVRVELEVAWVEAGAVAAEAEAGADAASDAATREVAFAVVAPVAGAARSASGEISTDRRNEPVPLRLDSLRAEAFVLVDAESDPTFVATLLVATSAPVLVGAELLGASVTTLLSELLDESSSRSGLAARSVGEISSSFSSSGNEYGADSVGTRKRPEHTGHRARRPA